jgi:outer membrane protein assembly factor BamA
MRRRCFRLLLSACVVLALSGVAGRVARPQIADDRAAILKTIHAEGIKHLSEPQLIALSGLTIGSPVGKPELQAAADRLVQTGLFATVNYAFQAKEEGGLYLTFKLVESPRVPAYFDNFPWFTEGELSEAIKKDLAFYDGTLPEAGATVDKVSEILGALTASRGMHTAVEHQVIANPIGEGTVQEFRIADVVLQISKIEFGDAALAANKTIRQHLGEVQGKAYSRMMIDLFLAEQVRPIYLQQGYLRVKLGPPEVRLSGNPSQKLPDQIPVFVPVTLGPVYKWKGAQWTGNTAVSVYTLNNLIGLKTGDVANGMTLEAAWDRMQEEYGHLGYLDAKVETETDFDDQAHTVYYRIKITEGRPYKFGKLVLTEISPAAERRLRAAWPILSGDVFDKTKFEEFLLKLQVHREQIFVDLPVHYDSIGHWLEKDANGGTVDVLMDFK